MVCTCIDTEGQARTADWKLRAATAIHDIAVERYGLAPVRPASSTPCALPLSTGMEESRRDGIETIEGIRRIKAELPGVYTIARPVQRLVRPQPGGPPGPQLGVPPRVRRGRPRRGHRPRARKILPAVARSTSGPARSASTSSTTAAATGYDPLTELLALFEGVGRLGRRHRGPQSGWPSSGASSTGSSTATATASRPTSTRPWPAATTPLTIVNDFLLAGMKTVGELFASGEMQLPFVLSRPRR